MQERYSAQGSRAHIGQPADVMGLYENQGAILRKILIIFAALGVSACTYNASAPVSPAYDVYSNYDDKLSGQYALYVDSEELAGEYSVEGYACSAHNYSQDATGAFQQSVTKTFQNLVENLELVDQPLSARDLEARGYTGMIIVEAEDIDVRINVIPGFWTSDMSADVELAASLRVDGREGRLLGTTVSGDDDAKAGAGAGCEGGAKALSEATSRALEDLMQRLGERLSNSRRLREAAEQQQNAADQPEADAGV